MQNQCGNVYYYSREFLAKKLSALLDEVLLCDRVTFALMKLYRKDKILHLLPTDLLHYFFIQVYYNTMYVRMINKRQTSINVESKV